MVHFRYIDEYLLCKKHAVEVKCGSEAARFHEITVLLAEGSRMALVGCGKKVVDGPAMSNCSSWIED